MEGLPLVVAYSHTPLLPLRSQRVRFRHAPSDRHVLVHVVAKSMVPDQPNRIRTFARLAYGLGIEPLLGRSGPETGPRESDGLHTPAIRSLSRASATRAGSVRLETPGVPPSRRRRLRIHGPSTPRSIRCGSVPSA